MNPRFLVLTAILFLFCCKLEASRIALWIPAWDANALSSLQQNAGSVDESNPVWYSMSASGAIVANPNAENPTWRAATVGTLLIPTLQNVVSGGFSATTMATLLATDSSREAHAQAIFDLVTAKVYDGIDIDYERMPTTSRAAFSDFVSRLSAKLHRNGKKLSITVYPKTSDAQNWNGPGAEDWVAMGRLADSVKIMAYDFHWDTSAPGPLTPLSWLDQVATYAESAIPAAKVLIGLPWYGYDWQGSTGKGVVYQQAMATALANGATISHDADGEATYRYADHVVYFQDAAAYSKKVDLIRQHHPNIGGFAHWRNGSEDPAFWKVVRSVRSAATATKGDFTTAGPANLPVRVGKSVTGLFTISRSGGSTDPVQISVLKPAGLNATVSVSVASLTGSATQTVLRVDASPAAPMGSYPLVLRFTSGAIVKEQTVVVTVRKTLTVTTL